MGDEHLHMSDNASYLMQTQLQHTATLILTYKGFKYMCFQFYRLL